MQEWPIALVRIQFAVIGMIDRYQCVNAGVACGLKFVELQLALEGRKYTDIDALQADRRLRCRVNMSAVLFERHPLERTVRRGNRRLDEALSAKSYFVQH